MRVKRKKIKRKNKPVVEHINKTKLSLFQLICNDVKLFNVYVENVGTMHMFISYINKITTTEVRFNLFGLINQQCTEYITYYYVSGKNRSSNA